MTTDTYTAGWNLPGCLPDTTEPLPEFDSVQEALQYLLEEASNRSVDFLLHGDNTLGTYNEAEAWSAFQEGLRRLTAEQQPRGPLYFDAPDGYRWFVEARS